MGKAGSLPSLFDILGPVMTGPSSSHTAGAVRIGRMGRSILGEEAREATITFHGALSETYKGHFTDSGVVAGLLGMDVDDPRIPEALDLARNGGMEVRVRALPGSQANPNTIDMELTGETDSVRVSAITVGGGEILVTQVGDVPVSLRGKSGVTLQEGVKSPRFLPPLYDYSLVNPEPLFATFRGLAEFAASSGDSIPEAVLAWESHRSGLDAGQVRQRLSRILMVMARSVEKGLSGRNNLVGGFMPGDDGLKLWNAALEGRAVSGDILAKAVARSLGAMEVNGSLGCVVAAPTAGSCGVVPGALMTVAEARNLTEPQVIDGLLAATMTGVLIAAEAPISGALGGCQSEIGVASAMAAAGLVQLGGGSPEAVCHGAALALKNLLGLICDPVGGPVEVPCIKRNSVGVANAFAAADMALAGIRSVIPPDEVVDALKNVQTLLPTELRGTMKGGLGCTRTAARLKEEWLAHIRSLKV
jgi:L-serine dehydratase